ncbi:XRE family transcriptional regulator [Alistipes putredinis]|uniref:XRE family transcriptional regulator n=1 Tax=Alistipes putredinis TaxID=28117 RepID=UPI003A8447F4
MTGDRLKLLRKTIGLTQEQLDQLLGMGKAALSMIETGKAALSSRNKNILVQELNVNPDWLDGGEGEMFNAEPDLTAYMHRTDNTLPLQSVPLYSIEGTAGLVPLFADHAQTRPVNFIHIPNLPKCDGAIYIVGDSMYPLLKSGDIVLYKQLKDIGDIFWGDMYLLSIDIDGEEYITVKYIQKSEREGYVKLVSQNPHHADKEVAVDRIRALALVKASIRMNSIR